jgi:NADH-quinone oxidoreductase subunit L
MPVTFATFGMGYLAIIGIPPLSGFFSKDPIIETAFAAGGAKGLLFGGAALLGAGITAFYMTRVMLMTFFGEKRWRAGTHPHESPSVMGWPMVVLAAGSIGAGALLAVGGRLEHWLEPIVGHHEPEHALPAWLLTVVTLAVVGVGVAIAYRMYARQPVPVSAPVNVSGLTVAARNDLYGDAFNERALMVPGRRFTKNLVDFDDVAVDGVTRELAALVGSGSQDLRLWQNGFARSYALSMLAGAALIAAAILTVRVW